MKKSTLFIAVIAILATFTTNAQTTKVSDVTLKNKIVVNETNLVLNGAGVREKLWIDLYVGALYLPQKSTNAKAIISSADTQAIMLSIVSGMITSEKMIKATNEGFEKATNGNTQAISNEIATFKTFFKEKIQKGDAFIIANTPNGVEVYKNNKKLGTINNPTFKKALFGIWLSDEPADEDLKEEMLGK